MSVLEELEVQFPNYKRDPFKAANWASYPNDGGLKKQYRPFGFGPSMFEVLAPSDHPRWSDNVDRSKKCHVCSIPFRDAQGRAIAMSYCCPRNDCPSAVTC